jgi:capsular exopolysaccharide synthesis family protein
MSRIHEALKKAAHERLSQATAGTVLDLGDVPPGFVSPSDVVRHIPAPTARNAPPSEDSSFLSFDDLQKRCAHPKWQLDSRMNVFLKKDNGRVAREQFRTLRSRLYQIAATRPLKRVLVTSSVPAEGKTTVAANLAHSIMRQPDRRVLLIDADLRSSRMHELFGAPSGPGLTDYLRGEADKYAVIQNGLEGNLCFIPGGSEASNPSELLLSDRMKKLLDLVAPVFDWIILDSPPALTVHDPSILADLCDGVLFVVKAGETAHQLAEKASSEFLKKNLLGVVLNRAEKDASYGGYYSGYVGDDREDTDRK